MSKSIKSIQEWIDAGHRTGELNVLKRWKLFNATKYAGTTKEHEYRTNALSDLYNADVRDLELIYSYNSGCIDKNGKRQIRVTGMMEHHHVRYSSIVTIQNLVSNPVLDKDLNYDRLIEDLKWFLYSFYYDESKNYEVLIFTKSNLLANKLSASYNLKLEQLENMYLVSGKINSIKGINPKETKNE